MEQTPQAKLDEEFLNAAAQGDIESAIEALTKGANLNSKSLKGNNALYLAGTRSRRDFFEWVLDVDQNGIKIDVNNVNNTNDTLLLELVRENIDSFYIKQLIKNGILVDAPSRDGVRALLQSCANNNFDTTKDLLEAGADPNLYNQENKTNPFLMSGAEGSFELVKLLVKHNAKLDSLDTYGRNILLNVLFKPTTYMKKEEKVENDKLLEYLVDSDIDLDYVAPSGVTAIWMASAMGKDNLVKKMLAKGVNVNRWHSLSTNEGKSSVLHEWCQSGKKEIVEPLLKMGAKLSIKNDEGNSPESFGWLKKDLRELLLQHNADVNAVIFIKSKDPNAGRVAMPVFPNIVAEGDSGKAVVEEMINRGVKTSYSERSWDQYDPLMMAICGSAPMISEMLLKQPGVNVNKLLKMDNSIKDSDSLSYMALAAADLSTSKLAGAMQQKQLYENLIKAKSENEKNGVQTNAISKEGFDEIEKHLKSLLEVENLMQVNKRKIFDTLIANGYDLELENESGKTALFYCKDKIYANWLQEAGSNIFHKDKQGHTPFFHAVLNGNTEMIDYYKTQYKVSKKLDDIYYRMAFEDFSISSGKAVQGIVHFAGGKELQEKLNAKPADFIKQSVQDIDYKDEDGNTALLVACANNIPFLASLYYKMGADVNAVNNLGETSLMHAIATKNAQMVEFLVKSDADCSAETKEGKSVLDFAIETGKLDILKAVKSSDKQLEVKKLKP